MLFDTGRWLRNAVIVGPLNRWWVRWLRGPNTPLVTNSLPLFPDLDPAVAAAILARNGYLSGLRLAPAFIEQVLREVPEETTISPHRISPAVRSLAENDKVVAVARQYLGTEPHFFESFVVWSPPGHHDYKQTFHFDVPDFKALSLFVYLTDVDQHSSPHQAIAGTHGSKTLRALRQQKMSDEWINNHYPDQVETIVGPPGTAFFEDQTVIHRALGGACRMRGAVILSYTIRRRSPFH